MSKTKKLHSIAPKIKNQKGELLWTNNENSKCSDTLGYQTKKSKLSKNKKCPPKTHKKKKIKEVVV